MHDLNFFEGRVDAKDAKANPKVTYIVVLGFLFLVLVGYIGHNLFLITVEKRTITNLKSIVENPKAVKRVEEILEKQTKTNQLQTSVTHIKVLDEDVSKRKKVDDALLAQINNSIPDNIYLTSLNIRKEEIHIMGKSRDRLSVAEFQRGLGLLEDYGEIFVSHISLEDDDYNFGLDIADKEEIEEIEEVAEEVVVDEGTNKE